MPSNVVIGLGMNGPLPTASWTIGSTTCSVDWNRMCVTGRQGSASLARTPMISGTGSLASKERGGDTSDMSGLITSGFWLSDGPPVAQAATNTGTTARIHVLERSIRFGLRMGRSRRNKFYVHRHGG